MPDDDRTRRRLGDETKGRIADLASGWGVDEPAKPSAAPASTPPKPIEPAKAPRGDETNARIAELASGWNVDAADTNEENPALAAPEPPPPPLPPRKKQKTLPPPPPGSHERKALEAAILDVNTGPAPKSEPVRAKTSSTAPPPVPAAAKRPPTQQVPVIGSGTPQNATTIGHQRGPVPARPGTSQSGSVSAIQPPPSSGGITSTTSQSGTAIGHKSGSVAAIQPPPSSGATAKPPSTTKSGPTETGTVNVSGVIGGMRPPTTTGPTAAGLPGVRPIAPAASAPTAMPKGAAIRDALPLRADTSGAMPAPPAPRPLPTLNKPPVSALPPDDSGEATEVDPNAHLTVPVGEFDHGGTLLDKDKLRVAYEQSTIKRDAASALLGLPEQPLTVVKAPDVEVLLGESAAQITRGDPTSIDPTSRFERGDPTLGPDATSIDPPSGGIGAGGRLRTQAALRRKRGIGGDVRYVATAVLGVRRARRELGELELQQATRLKSRARHLLTLGRAAIGSEGYDHPALNKAREALAIVEDERAQHTATVAAADSELMRVRTDRADKAKAYAENIVKADAELADITKKLEPLEKEVIAATKRASELHESLRRIDAKIAATEASKTNVKMQKVDPASIQAELASLKADRIGVERDEPKIAAELDALNPRVAALEARRIEARKRRADLDEEEKKDQGRAQELLAAIGAKRKVVDRAAADAEAMRDKILLELGERIYVDRPTSMTFELAPVDAIDVELGVTDRRMMELKEIISSVDKAKLARGIAVIIGVLSVVGAIVWWLLYMLG